MYVMIYDPMFDDLYQCFVEDSVRLSPGMETSETPFPDVPIKSRFRSVNHPGWDKDDSPIGGNAEPAPE
jgi:hypothetical protein